MKWQPIETAPKDGTMIDVWCVPPDDAEFEPEGGGIRLTNISWNESSTVFPHDGWVRMCDDGDWDLVEGDLGKDSPCMLPAWILTHWMFPPKGPDND